MPNTTPNLNLQKPLENETADIAVINGNMDILDAEVSKKASQMQDGRMSKEDKAKIDALAAVAISGNYNDLTDRPATFAPTAHKSTHVTGGTDALSPSDIGALPNTAGAAADTVIGNRTVDPTQVPSGLVGTITQLFSWITNRIKAITGGTNWYDAPATTIANLNTNKVNKAGDTMSGLLTVALGALGTTAGNTLTLFDTYGTSSNVVHFKVQLRRTANGTDWTTCAIDVFRYTDVTQQQIITFNADGSTLALPLCTIGGNTPWTNANDGSGSGLDADTVDGKHASDFAYSAMAYASATFTDSIAASGTLQKTIPLGGNYRFANVYFHGKSTIATSNLQGMLVKCTTDSSKTLVIGAMGSVPSTWSRSFLGAVAKANSSAYYGTYSYGGGNTIAIDELYISGSNIVINFRNTYTGALSIDTHIEVEAW